MPLRLVRTDSIARCADTGPAAFVCTLRAGGAHAAWVQVSGELDFVGAPLLEDTLRQAEERAWLVVLDLAELVSVDIAAVHVISYASIHARRSGRRLVLLPGRPSVDRVFAPARESGSLEFIDLDPEVQQLRRQHPTGANLAS